MTNITMASETLIPSTRNIVNGSEVSVVDVLVVVVVIVGSSYTV